MAKQEHENRETNYGSSSGRSGPSFAFIAGMCILGGVMLRSWYHQGVDVANRVLRRHDKDVRMLERKMNKEKKERLKEEKRKAKEQLNQQRSP